MWRCLGCGEWGFIFDRDNGITIDVEDGGDFSCPVCAAPDDGTGAAVMAGCAECDWFSEDICFACDAKGLPDKCPNCGGEVQ